MHKIPGYLSCSTYITLLVFVLSAFGYIPRKEIEIRGVYGHPGKLWEKGYTLNSLGVNAIFVHDKSISNELMDRARKENVKVFAEFATLNGKGYVEEHPAAWAIDSSGNKVQPATWFMGVCPSDTVFRQFRLDEMKKLVRRFDVDGVWMDYVHWHAQFEDPEPILPETCFCEKCLRKFHDETGTRIEGQDIPSKARFILLHHDAAWRNWRSAVIAEWVHEFKRTLKKEKPAALLGLYHCPWDDNDFANARYRILGLDYGKLKNDVDVFSPMVYHRRMGRKPQWVKENIEWFSKVVPGSRIWPIVQAYNDPGVITASEFRDVLLHGLSGASTGVMMFTTDAIADDTAKISAMKSVYTSLKAGH